MKTFTFIFLIMGLVSFDGFAQGPTLSWAFGLTDSVGPGGQDRSEGIAYDSHGHIYVTGYVRQNVDFDPSSNSVYLAGSGIDIYLAKYDTSGNYLWGFVLDGSGINYSHRVIVDNNDNVILVGEISDSIDFDPGQGTALHYRGGFVAQYDSSGNFLWAFDLSDSPWMYVRDVVCDDSSNVYITGDFQDSVDFDPGPGTAWLSEQFNNNIYIAKYSSNGSFIWAKGFGGALGQNSLTIALDRINNIYIGGYFENTADFDPSPAVAIPAVYGNEDVFLASYDPQGNFKWVKSMGGISQDRITSLKVDSAGYLLIVGQFTYMGDFDPDTATTDMLYGNGSWDLFISKFDTTGTYYWAESMGGVGSEYAYQLILGDSNEFYICGSFDYSCDFDPGVASHLLYDSADWDSYIAAYSADGSFLWAIDQGGDSSAANAHGITRDQAHNIYVTGLFRDTADFDPSPALMQEASKGSFDPFVAKYVSCFYTQSFDSVVACDSYTWIDGNTYVNSTTSPVMITSNAAGCDSIIGLVLTIVHADTSVSVVNDTLIANQSGASYQWIDCLTGIPVPGAINQEYYSIGGGVFAVIVSMNSCDDTSNCHVFLPSTVPDAEGSDLYIVTFNSANSILTINTRAGAEIVLRDTQGRVIMNFETTQQLTDVCVNGIAEGIYFVTRTLNGEGVTQPVFISY